MESALSFEKFNFKLICLKDHGSTSDGCWDIEILKMWNAKKNIKGGTLDEKNFSWKTKMKSTGNCLIWREKLKKSGQQIWPWNKSNIQTLFRAIFIIKKLNGAHQIENKWYIYSKQHKIMLFKLKNNTGCRVCHCVFRRGSWHYLNIMLKLQ